MLRPEAPPRYLSDVEVDQFWSDGVLLVRGLYSGRWIDTIKAGLNQIAKIEEGSAVSVANPAFFSNAYTWHANDHVRDFSLFAPTAHLVAQILRSERLNFFGDQVFVKHALNAERTPWHHDMTFFPLAGNKVASVWTCVDPVRRDASALEFIAGSHRWPQRFRPLGVGGIVKSTKALETTPDFDADGNEHEIKGWDLEPGDAVIFHGLTLHASRGRPSGQHHRRAIATRWCGDDVVFAPSDTELKLAWPHGMTPGQPIGGPVFPQVLPQFNSTDIAARMSGPVSADSAIVQENAELAKKFIKIPL